MIEGLKPYPKMKDSGVPWLGRVPEHWEVRRIRDVATMLVSNVDKHSHEGELPVRLCNYVDVYRHDVIRPEMAFMRATAKEAEVGRFRLHRDDVLITKDSETWTDIGVPAYVFASASDLVCGYHLAILRPHATALDGQYLFFAMQSNGVAHQLHVEATGVTRFGLSHDSIRSTRITVPPLPDQLVIRDFLGSSANRIRRLIRSKQKLVTLLEEQKQAIIHRAVTRGLDPNVDFKPSGIEMLGDVPAHWDKPLNQRVFRERIRPHEGRTEVQLSLSQRDGLIATEDMKERSLQTSSFDNWKVVYPGDLVLNRFKAHLGVFFASTLRGIVSFHYGVFAARQPLVAKYFELLYHTRPYRAIYAGRSNGMTVGLQNLSNQNFYNVRTLVPPIPEQEAIVSYVTSATETLVRAQRDAQREIDLLKEFRTRLISDIVTGKLDVREAAARLPAESFEGDDPFDDTNPDGEDDDDSAAESGLEDGDGG